MFEPDLIAGPVGADGAGAGLGAVSAELEAGQVEVAAGAGDDEGGFAARFYYSPVPHYPDASVAYAVQIAGDLDESVLAIQGPPGTGKTHCGAEMICRLVADGKRVGVTGPSHKVIRVLLDKVAEVSAKNGIATKLGQKVTEVEDGADGPAAQSRVKEIEKRSAFHDRAGQCSRRNRLAVGRP